MNYIDYVQTTKNFPKEGVVFFDFTPLLGEPKIFNQAINDIEKHFADKNFNKIAAIESKGFTLGSALAFKTGKPLCLIRKPGLTPGKILREKFEKEYGYGEYQVKENAFNDKDNVLIIYDIMAGAGATQASINLIERTGAKVAGCAYVIELEYLKGREQLNNYDLFSLVRIKDK
jgi:adenine phosphoribosyltransferase